MGTMGTGGWRRMALAGTTSCAFLAMRAKVPLARPVRAAAGRKRPVALRAKDGEKQLRKAVRKVLGREVEGGRGQNLNKPVLKSSNAQEAGGEEGGELKL